MRVDIWLGRQPSVSPPALTILSAWGKKAALNGNRQARPGSPPLQKHGFPFNYAWTPGEHRLGGQTSQRWQLWWQQQVQCQPHLWSLTLSVCGIILQKHKSARLHIVPINNVFLSELERMDLNASVKITNMAPSTRLQLPAVLTLAMMGGRSGECENDRWIGEMERRCLWTDDMWTLSILHPLTLES